MTPFVRLETTMMDMPMTAETKNPALPLLPHRTAFEYPFMILLVVVVAVILEVVRLDL